MQLVRCNYKTTLPKLNVFSSYPQNPWYETTSKCNFRTLAVEIFIYQNRYLK